MLENLYGTFTFGLIITSIATLIGFVIFQYILWPILKLILTPIIGGSLVIGKFFNVIFEHVSNFFSQVLDAFGEFFGKKKLSDEEKKARSQDPQSFENKIGNNYFIITSIFVVLPFSLFIICIENLIIHKKFFTLDLNIFIDTFFAIFGLVIYGVAISFGLKALSKDNYKFYIPFVFLFMAFFIIRDKFF